MWRVLLISFPIWAAEYPITVLGGDEASFAGESILGESLESPFDVVVVGGGLAGLTAALYLSDSNLKVLVLEKEAEFGGLSAGGEENGIRYCRGAAYWTPAYEEELKILERIGLADYERLYSIAEPIDSYLWNGHLYEGFWEHQEVLNELPRSFALFKHELEIADRQGLIPNQPMEYAPRKALDKIDARAWIRTMPKRAATRTDDESKAIYAAFLADARLDPKNPMKEVVEFVDLFSRSALGAPTSHLSAMAFANFYISEIDVRYASEIGTGVAAEKLKGLLTATAVEMRSRAKVIEIKKDGDLTRVRFFYQNGKALEAKTRFVVFAAQLGVAAKVIQGLKERAPEQYKLFSDLHYAHFAIHNLWTEGHPYRATYDTWVRASDYRSSDFTDVINARWQDPGIRGYEGMRDFKKDPADAVGIFTIYNPLLPGWVGQGFGEEAARIGAQSSTDRFVEIFSPLLRDSWKQSLQVKKVETYRWPFSLHMVEPGHFSKAHAMRKPFENVYFANNNLGTPSFEEALFRGHCAAVNIRLKLDSSFKKEEWTRCTIE